MFDVEESFTLPIESFPNDYFEQPCLDDSTKSQLEMKIMENNELTFLLAKQQVDFDSTTQYLSDTNVELKQQLEAKQAEIKHLEDMVLQYKCDIGILNMKIYQMSYENQRMKEYISDLVNETNTMRSQIEALKVKDRSNISKINVLQKKVHSLSTTKRVTRSSIRL
jgi:predicted  nucleic acid-binding Zn-ribbon protein